MSVSRQTITNFRSQLFGGGARPNLFSVELTLPTGANQSLTGIVTTPANFSERLSFLCKAAALPASNISPIEVPFRGRTLKVAGDRTFDTWTITVINDSDFYLRTIFEQWMGSIGQHQTHGGFQNPAAYQSNATVKHLGRQPQGVGPASGLGTVTDETVIATYSFEGIFPTNVAQIDLSYDTTDTIEEFTVEFQVNYWSRGLELLT